MTGLYQLMPSLTAEEYNELRDDIAANGVTVPIITTEGGEIIDGHHRARIARALGVPCPEQQVSGYSEAELRDMAFRLNAHRRHLSREQRRELIVQSVKTDPELSNRQHAERTGVDHKTVAPVRAQLENRGEIPHVSERRDSTGRQQPASKPTPRTPSVPEPIDRNTGEIQSAPVAEPPQEPSPHVAGYLANDQQLQDKSYLAQFAAAITRSDDFMEFDPERIGRIADELAIKSLDEYLTRVEQFVAKVKRARGGLRLVEGAAR